MLTGNRIARCPSCLSSAVEGVPLANDVYCLEPHCLWIGVNTDLLLEPAGMDDPDFPNYDDGLDRD